MHDRTAPFSRIVKSSPTRLELRFACDEAAATRLWELELLQDFRQKAARTRRSRQLYFDTAQWHLRDSNVSLVIEQGNGRITQRTKRKPSSALKSDFSFEIETVLASDAQPDRPVLTGFHAPTDALICAHENALFPYLKMEIVQRLSAGAYGEARISLIHETSIIQGVNLEDSLEEQQLVLVHAGGDISDFHDFARALSSEAGLSLTGYTGQERALQKLKGNALPVVKAGKMVLPADASALSVARLSFDQAVQQVTANGQAAAAGQPDAIKQLRVGLRRLRSLERLFRKSLQHPALNRLIPAAKEYGRILGVARDWDVFIEATLPDILSAPTLEESDQAILLALAHGAEGQRAWAREKVRQALQSPAFTRLCIDLREQTDPVRWPVAGRRALEIPAEAYARQALGKRLRKVNLMGEDLASAPAHARHPLRVELKKLRYAVQAFRPLYEKERRKPYLSAMSDLQDAFGVLNDAVVAREMALAAATPERRDQMVDVHRAMGASFVIGWSAQQLQGQADIVYQAWSAFSQTPPFWEELEHASGEIAEEPVR